MATAQIALIGGPTALIEVAGVPASNRPHFRPAGRL
jgi:hypothetical protein